MSAADGTLLVVLPHLPGRAEPGVRLLLSELSRLRPVRVCAVGPSPAERAALRALGDGVDLAPRPLGAALAESLRLLKPAAVVVVDGPATRGALSDLSRLDPRLPAILACFGRSKSPAGQTFAAPREAWFFGGGPAVAPAGVLPQASFSQAAPTRAWLERRLQALSAPPAPKDPALASVIVPCWNGLRWTRECLPSVLRWTRRPFELIVVDNGSQDGTADYVRSLPSVPGASVRLLRNKTNLGFARAINQGMATARGRHLVWLNSDAVVTPGWLERLAGWAERAPWVGAVGPCTNEIAGVQRVAQVAYRDMEALPSFAQAWALGHAGRAKPVHRLTGFCLLVPREAYRRIGGLDERFGLGCYEDFDYCLRLRQAGYELVLAEDVFVHHHGHKAFTENGTSNVAHSNLNREVFVEKWCRRSLEFLDELDPLLAHGRAPAR